MLVSQTPVETKKEKKIKYKKLMRNIYIALHSQRKCHNSQESLLATNNKDF
jgi:hypothetical protein